MTVHSTAATAPQQLTAVTVVVRAVVAGALGGLLAAVFILVVGEDSIDAAIAIEEATAEGSAVDGGDDALISRDLQVVGGFVGGLLYGLFSGLAFGTVFAAIRHRIPAADDFRRSVLLAAGAFLATALAPAVKYPANPPAVGDPATVGQRTVYYLTFVAASIVLLVAIAMLHHSARRRFEPATSVVVAAIGGTAGFALLLLLWPDSPDRVPAGFPADLLWRFRLQSLATLALSWATLGLGLGWMLSRLDAGVTSGPRS